MAWLAVGPRSGLHGVCTVPPLRCEGSGGGGGGGGEGTARGGSVAAWRRDARTAPCRRRVRLSLEEAHPLREVDAAHPVGAHEAVQPAHVLRAERDAQPLQPRPQAGRVDGAQASRVDGEPGIGCGDADLRGLVEHLGWGLWWVVRVVGWGVGVGGLGGGAREGGEAAGR